jgi:hypothetical protein
MREGVEGGFASVCALPRVSNSAKGESGDRAVVVRVVDGGTAGGDFVKDYVMSVFREGSKEKFHMREIFLLLLVSAFNPKA